MATILKMPAWEIDQSYDGVNQPLKRVETRRTETLIGGGPVHFPFVIYHFPFVIDCQAVQMLINGKW